MKSGTYPGMRNMIGLEMRTKIKPGCRPGAGSNKTRDRGFDGLGWCLGWQQSQVLELCLWTCQI